MGARVRCSVTTATRRPQTSPIKGSRWAKVFAADGHYAKPVFSTIKLMAMFAARFSVFSDERRSIACGLRGLR